MRKLNIFVFEVSSCGVLHVPYSYKTYVDYLQGSAVTFTGCRAGYTFQGPNRYECVKQPDGHSVWAPTPGQSQCRCESPLKDNT